MSDRNFEIAVMLQDAAWQEDLEGLEDLVKEAMQVAWRRLRQAQPGTAGAVPTEVSLVFADDAAVAELNRGYRGREGPTNVLSFPNMDDEDFLPAGLEEGDPFAALPRLLGDVVVARQTVLREAAEQGKSLRDHTLHLLVHGLLHLAGYGHDTDDEADEMEALETAILADLGVADPYRPAPGGPQTAVPPQPPPGDGG